jgi:hypothetical protein
MILRNFFMMKTAHRFIRDADIQRTCEPGPCGGTTDKDHVLPDDLEISDNVAPVDRPRKCGSSDCFILGNVEVAKGTLFRDAG